MWFLKKNECLAKNIRDKMHFSLRMYAPRMLLKLTLGLSCQLAQSSGQPSNVTDCLEMLYHSGSVQLAKKAVNHCELSSEVFFLFKPGRCPPDLAEIT